MQWADGGGQRAEVAEGETYARPTRPRWPVGRGRLAGTLEAMPYPHVIRLRGPWEYEPLARFSTDGLSIDRPRAQATGESTPERAVVARGDQQTDLPAPGRVQLPADWGDSLGRDFCGRVRYRRRFNRPTNLEPAERVWLVIDGVDARGDYTLNGHKLGSIDGYALPAASDITHLLAPSNVLEIDVELAAPLCPPPAAGAEQPAAGSPLPAAARPGRAGLAGGPIGEVWLEVRADAHIQGLSVHCTPGEPSQLCVRGEVISAVPGERLSVVVTACDYEVVFAEVTAGERFALTASADDWPCWPDAMDEPVLTPVEVRLLRGAKAIWQTVVQTAPLGPVLAKPRQSMVARALAGEYQWLDFVTEQDTAWQELLARPGTVVGLRAILPEAAYHALDRATSRSCSMCLANGCPSCVGAWHIIRQSWPGPRPGTRSPRRATVLVHEHACGRLLVPFRNG